MRRLALALTTLLACASEPAGDAEDSASSAASESTGAESGASEGTSTETGTGTETDGGETGEPLDPSFDDGRVLNIAHRGGVDEVPEHTLLAYAHALEVGADVIEVDLQLTADGVPVALHDDDVDRTTDGTGPIATMTLAEAQALDAGYQFTPDAGRSFPYRGMGLTIPSFEELLDALAGELIAVEVKSGDLAVVQPIVDAIASRDIYEEIYVWSGEPDIAEALREADPQLAVGLTYAEMLQLAALADEDEASYVPPGPFAQIPLVLNSLEILDAALVERCGRVGITVHAWTINDVADMQELIGWGVDGIITDRPTTLEMVLEDEGMP